MSGRKGSRTNVHPGRNKKKISGNRFTTQNDTEYTSASAKKKLRDGMRHGGYKLL